MFSAGTRLGFGAAAGAAAAARFGPDDTPLTDRLSYGAAAGAGLGLAAPAAWNATRRYAPGTARRAFDHFAGVPARYNSWRAAKKGVFESGARSLGTVPLMGIGAALGGLIGRATDRDGEHSGMEKGAVIGAAAGALVKPVLKTKSAWSALSKIPFGRTLAVTGVSALAAGAWMARSQPAQRDMAVPDAAGQMQIVSGVRDRLDMMGATGNVVLGMHSGRHG